LDVKDRKSVERKDGTLTKAFTNYVGIGVDARVTYTVEKIRTPYACINKMLYACVGFLNLLRPIKPIKKIISSFTESTGGFLSS
jgi:diacylglycerol kinase family enzyme